MGTQAGLEAWIGAFRPRALDAGIPAATFDAALRGVQFSPNYLAPTLPLDLSVGFFTQQIDAGTIVETDASSFFLAASKNYGMATIYGGFAKEEGKMKVSYTEEETDATIEFETESVMDNRFTVGVSLNLGAKLYAEAGFGDLSGYSAGLIFGM